MLVPSVLALGLWPPLADFCVWFMAHSCDEELSPAGNESGFDGNIHTPVRMSPRVTIVETFPWLFILGVFFVLCFTPLALVIGSVSGFLQ
jgi:hypothetical protein